MKKNRFMGIIKTVICPLHKPFTQFSTESMKSEVENYR